MRTGLHLVAQLIKEWRFRHVSHSLRLSSLPSNPTSMASTILKSLRWWPNRWRRLSPRLAALAWPVEYGRKRDSSWLGLLRVAAADDGSWPPENIVLISSNCRIPSKRIGCGLHFAELSFFRWLSASWKRDDDDDDDDNDDSSNYYGEITKWPDPWWWRQ